MFNNMKEEKVIRSWNIWCDEKGNLWCREIPFQVLDAEDYSEEEKAALLSDRKAEYMAHMQDSWKEKQAVLGDMDAVRAAEQWDDEYNIRRKYLPLFIPEWILSSEDIALLSANICTPLFVDNIKKYAQPEEYFHIGYDDFVPDPKKIKPPLLIRSRRISYLKAHPYITESMECFVSMNWGVWDYPDGEILVWEEFADHCKITCARRDDWDFDTFRYVSTDFLNCKIIVSEYDFDMILYAKGNETHSFVNLCNCEVTKGADRRCRFHFLIEDEYGKYYDLILECDDVSVEDNKEFKFS